MSVEVNRAMRAGGLAALVVCVFGLVAGCGGGKRAAGVPATQTTGSAVINIYWPPREGDAGRVIPSNANSIAIRVFAGAELPQLRRVIPRPAGAGTLPVRIDQLPLGPVLFVAEAFSDSAAQVQPPLASGSQTVTIGRDAPAQVTITLSPFSGGTGSATAYATVIVSNIPAGAASVVVRVLQNGQVITPAGSPPAIPRTADLPFSAVPLRLGPLPAGSLLFMATALGPGGQADVVARGSAIAQLTSGSETTVNLPLAPGSGGTGSDAQQQTTGGAVLNISNVGTGDALLVVDPMPGDRTVSDPAPIQVPLQGAFVQPNLPISRVPVLVAGLAPGPWLFVVTTHTGLTVADPVSRIGSTTATVAAGNVLSLDVPLGNAQSAAPPRQDGDLVVRTTNITAAGVQVVLVSVFDSTGRVRQQVIPHTPGVSERVASFSLPGGPYTAVSAAYGGTGFDRAQFDAALAADTSTIPAGALAIGSSTVTVTGGQAATADVELRLQGDSGSGSVNLAMLNVPVVVELKDVGGTKVAVITSGVVVRVFSVRDNEEIPSLRQVMVPPSSSNASNPDGGLLNLEAQYDQLRPLRLRIDGVPLGATRFEVTATRNGDGTGPILGRGSVVAQIERGVNAVTVTVLPHGDLGAGATLPGITNEPSDENPQPTSLARARMLSRWRRPPGRR